MVTPNKKTRRPASSTMSRLENNEAMKRQIFALISFALCLFFMGTLVLMLKMPDPSDAAPDVRHGVDTVVRGRLDGVTRRNAERIAEAEPELQAAVHHEEITDGHSHHHEMNHKLIDEINELHAKAEPELQAAVHHEEITDVHSHHHEMNHKLIDEINELHAKVKESRQRKIQSTQQQQQQQQQQPKAFVPHLREQVSKSKQALLSQNMTAGGESPPRLIHILETRFMQNQPHLVELAKARLYLFTTICLPTVIRQSVWGEFVWVIRTDPDLDEGIKKELIHLLETSGALREVAVGTGGGEEKRSLTYVVGSNDNYILANSTTFSTEEVKPFDIRHMLSKIIENPSSVFAGRVSSASALLKEINSKQSDLERGSDDDVILWTRLDADDGINLGYMEYIQSQAVRYFLPEFYGKEIMTEAVVDSQGRLVLPAKVEVDGSKGERLRRNRYMPPKWTYWCAGRNIDWFITDVVRQPLLRNGTVYPVQHINVCVTPGVTIALRGSFDPHQVPRLDHDKIISYLRPNGPKLCQRKGLSLFDESADTEESSPDKEEPDDGSCFHMVNAYYFAALRSRTPTSAGMFGLSPTETQVKIVQKLPIIQYAMWVLMVREFGVSEKKLISTNEYFGRHVFDIAEENARGQCTQGHSCKTSSKDLLQQYADLKSEMIHGFDIVDGVAIST